MTAPSIMCPRCGAVSFNANDIAKRYCGQCHQFHEFMRHRFQPDHNGECLVCDNWADWPLHDEEPTP
jgi:ribosomal protein S27AE